MFQREEISDYNLILGVFQVIDLLLNISQVSNDVLLKELQEQDRKYLSKIIKQNEDIQATLDELLKNISNE